MHRLPVWSLVGPCSDPTLMQPCRGASGIPGQPHAQTDARSTPPCSQSCCQTTQGDTKWEQGFCSASLHTYTMWFILSDSYPHTQHNASRQQLEACSLLNYSILARLTLKPMFSECPNLNALVLSWGVHRMLLLSVTWEIEIQKKCNLQLTTELRHKIYEINTLSLLFD